MSRNKKLFNLTPETLTILECICLDEGITASELLRLLVRAWRMAGACDEKFVYLTTWRKGVFTARIVQKELEEIKGTVRK